MNVAEGFFHSPVNEISAFADAQVLLYRHDPSLQDYFMMLQLDSLCRIDLHLNPLSSFDRLIGHALKSADNVNQFRGRPKLKADVLFCPMPDFARKTETQFLVRTLLGLAETGATILCLLPTNAPCRAELDSQLAAAGRTRQVTFLDPSVPLNRIDARLRWMVSKVRAHKALEETQQILGPHGLNPGAEMLSHFQHIANQVEAWERLAPWVEFESAVVRCHWHALCSPVCRTARDRGKPVITFQQGVITHTLDVPVTASMYVAFGDSSVHFLDRLNHRFLEAVQMPAAPVQYVSGGSLYDTITPLADQYDEQCLLIVDVPQPEGQGEFYGVKSQCQALLELAESVLTSSHCRVVIRPHPFWSKLDLTACQCLVRRHSSRCELSHPSWPLEYDLGRASVVAGIFSGVLTVSSACGLPTIFLQTDGGYTTGDLDCFAPQQTLMPKDALREIKAMMTDRQTYSRARAIALRNARSYYANGTNLNFSGGFFESLLGEHPAAPQAQPAMAR